MKPFITWLGLLLVATWLSPAAAIETARVEVVAGSPRLVVDGQPIRTRVFWGTQGSKRFPLGPEAQTISFEFSPIQDEPGHATLHLRFDKKPGRVWLDELHVVDVDTGTEVLPAGGFERGEADFTGNWHVFPTGPANTVGKVQVVPGVGRDGSAGLEVTLQEPAEGRWPDFHLYAQPRLALRMGHTYRVTLWVCAETKQELALAFYRPGQTFIYLGGPDNGYVNQIQLAAAAGVDLVSFPLGMPWPKPGEEPNWSGPDMACQQVLATNPRALLLPRFDMGPPAWWRQANPEEMMAWDRPMTVHGAEVASAKYRQDAAERLAALVKHLEEKFGPHMLGYHPCGQNTGEWFYEDTWGPALNGYAPSTARAFRAWLAQRYANDAALQTAWQSPQVTLATAEVPTSKARRATPAGLLRDPVAERAVLDFTEFQQDAMAECVCHFAQTIRQASQGRKLVVFFYGYVFEFGAVRNGAATAGHYALRRALECPDIDVLCSPISYFDRGLGENAPSMTAAESVALAGKMWLYEDDTRTALSSPDAGYGRVDTIEGTCAVLRRNTAQCAVRNFGTWWMDLTASGWFNDPRLWEEMKHLRGLDEALLQNPRAFRPEVAAVIDEASMNRVAFGGDRLTRPAIYVARRPLGRMGAPYGQYLLDDVTAGRVSAKMYVLLNAWCLSAEQRRQLLDATRGSLRLWCYAPGYQEPQGLSPEGMRELTGFVLKDLGPGSAWATPTAAGQAAGLTEAFGVRESVQPRFAATDATPEETLACYEDGSAAVALRKTGDNWSLFVGPPGLTSELLRLAARRAGVHLFTPTDCNVYANGPYVVLHAAKDSPLELDTGRSAPIRDLLSGESLGPGPKLTLPVKAGETRVLQVE